MLKQVRCDKCSNTFWADLILDKINRLETAYSPCPNCGETNKIKYWTNLNGDVALLKCIAIDKRMNKESKTKRR